MGHKALSKVQLGREATAGTEVDADFVWRGPFAGLQDARETTLVDENIGIALPSSRSYAAMLLAELSLPATPLTPEQAPHIFEAAIKQVEDGTEDGTGSSGYTYTYAFGATSLNTVSTYTIETGDEDQAEKATFCFVQSFTITAVKGETVQISSDWVGRQVEDGSFTGSVTAPSVSHLHASTGQLYIDDNDGNFGDTAVSSGNILEATLTIETGLTALFTIDSGQLYFHGMYFNSDDFSAELELKWVHDDDAVTERGKWRSNTPRLVRLEYTGEDYGTEGTGTEFSGKKGLRIDFPGAYTEFSAVEHEEGKSIVTATMGGGYDNDSAEALTILVANETDSLA